MTFNLPIPVPEIQSDLKKNPCMAIRFLVNCKRFAIRMDQQTTLRRPASLPIRLVMGAAARLSMANSFQKVSRILRQRESRKKALAFLLAGLVLFLTAAGAS